MTDLSPGNQWHSKVLQPRLPVYRRPMRPADVSGDLARMMLTRRHALEDVNYTKVVPNRFMVEVSHDTYDRYYQAILHQVVRQWKEKLLAQLNTANRRYGRKEFRLGGPIHIEVRPVQDLKPYQTRILARIDSEMAGEQTAAMIIGPCLELLPGGKRFALQSGITTIGRDKNNTIAIEDQEVHERRLVSSNHAYIAAEGSLFRIFDGSPEGRPSLNGTYVNQIRVTEKGRGLQDGDTVILAATNPSNPRPDVPGVVAFQFHARCF